MFSVSQKYDVGGWKSNISQCTVTEHLTPTAPPMGIFRPRTTAWQKSLSAFHTCAVKYRRCTCHFLGKSSGIRCCKRERIKKKVKQRGGKKREQHKAQKQKIPQSNTLMKTECARKRRRRRWVLQIASLNQTDRHTGLPL